jgi:hypothetical protein
MTTPADSNLPSSVPPPVASTAAAAQAQQKTTGASKPEVTAHKTGGAAVAAQIKPSNDEQQLAIRYLKRDQPVAKVNTQSNIPVNEMIQGLKETSDGKYQLVLKRDSNKPEGTLQTKSYTNEDIQKFAALEKEYEDKQGTSGLPEATPNECYEYLKANPETEFVLYQCDGEHVLQYPVDQFGRRTNTSGEMIINPITLTIGEQGVIVKEGFSKPVQTNYKTIDEYLKSRDLNPSKGAKKAEFESFLKDARKVDEKTDGEVLKFIREGNVRITEEANRFELAGFDSNGRNHVETIYVSKEQMTRIKGEVEKIKAARETHQLFMDYLKREKFKGPEEISSNPDDGGVTISQVIAYKDSANPTMKFAFVSNQKIEEYANRQRTFLKESAAKEATGKSEAAQAKPVTGAPPPPPKAIVTPSAPTSATDAVKKSEANLESYRLAVDYFKRENSTARITPFPPSEGIRISTGGSSIYEAQSHKIIPHEEIENYANRQREFLKKDSAAKEADNKGTAATTAAPTAAAPAPAKFEVRVQEMNAKEMLEKLGVKNGKGIPGAFVVTKIAPRTFPAPSSRTSNDDPVPDMKNDFNIAINYCDKESGQLKKIFVAQEGNLLYVVRSESTWKTYYETITSYLETLARDKVIDIDKQK